MIQNIVNAFYLKLGLIKEKDMYQVRPEVNDGETWKSLRANRVRTMKTNLANGTVNPNDEIIQESGQTLLHQSIVVNKFEIFTLALLYNANVNQKTKEGMSPLHLAASLGRTQMVDQLLSHGAAISDKDPLGLTAADRAELYEHQELAQFLRKYEQEHKE